VLCWLLLPPSVSAHAALDTSTPVNGDVLESAPAEITATFTEPLEQSYSRLQLFDSLGTEIEGTSVSFGEDGYTMVLSVPESLPNGTYSVLWRTLSEADGHTAQNYFAFTVGSNADIVPVAIPGSATDDDAVPQWAKTTSRWAALLGVAALIACWPVWSTIVRPALTPVRRQAVPVVRRMRRYVAFAVVVAILGSLYALLVQAWSLPDGTFLDKVINTLGQTRYGHLWLARIGLVMGLGLVLAACGWWYMKRRQVEGAIAWVVAAALTLPFSLIAHASAQTSGRMFAIIADAIHLFAASIWAGGIGILVFVVLPGLRGMDQEDRRRVLRHLLPRFSTMALICMAAIGVTGFYAGWLHVGNWAALTSTDYGRALIVKLALLALILVLAAINLLVIERKLAARDTDNNTSSTWSRRVRWTVAGELALIVLLLAAVGQMTSLQPARDVMVEDARQISIEFETASPSSTLLLAPGVAGVNHFRLEVSGPDLPTDAEALLRLTIPDREDLGTKEIQLSRVAGNAFEHHGSEISISADWDVTAIIREKGKAPVSAETSVAIGTTAPDVDVPGNPWRFNTLGGVTGLILVLVGIAGLVVGFRSGPGTTRKESSGLGVAAVLLGVILLFQARIDPILANAGGDSAIDSTDIAMVERGEEVYIQQCLSCHGPELRGDGPASEGMEPPPADFSQPHTMVHSDEDLIYWVRNGKQGTAMPGFQDTLSDQEIRDVLSYVEAEQDAMSGNAAATSAGACVAPPTTLEELAELAGSGEVPPATDLTAARGDTVDEDTAGAILVTTNELLACTNAMDTMRRMSLYTDAYLSGVFAAGVSQEFILAAEQAPVPRPADQQIELIEIRDVAWLDDRRVVATVVTVDSIVDEHDHQAAGTGGDDQLASTSEVVFALVGDTWLVDEIIVP
jgi:copper transport protein